MYQVGGLDYMSLESRLEGKIRDLKLEIIDVRSNIGFWSPTV